MRTATFVLGVEVALAAALFWPGPVAALERPEKQASPKPAPVGPSDAPATRVVEIRSYNLKAGARDRFHERLERAGVPMLRRWNIDVVAYGPSLHDRDSYFLMRSFPSVAERERSEEAFYGSDEWQKGLREAVLADIVSYTTVVLRVDETTLRALRGMGSPLGEGITRP